MKKIKTDLLDCYILEPDRFGDERGYFSPYFIADNLKMGYSEVIIIHGKSTNILTEEVHKVLKRNKNVRKYYKNNWNLGETIVEINEQK